MNIHINIYIHIYTQIIKCFQEIKSIKSEISSSSALASIYNTAGAGPDSISFLGMGCTHAAFYYKKLSAAAAAAGVHMRKTENIPWTSEIAACSA